MWHRSIIDTIGNTPLIQLNNIASHIKATVLVKVEYFNPGNSVKDRIGIRMLEDAERKGLIKPGGTIIECTSGNTGMGLALAAIVKGYRCIFTINDKQSKEKIEILRALGAEVIVCPTAVAHDDPQSYYSVAKQLAAEIPNSFHPNQYDNFSNMEAHYTTTGPEIWEQTEGKITHWVAGLGTCGTLIGTSKFLKEKNPLIKTIGIDTYGSVLKKYFDTGIVDENEVYPYLVEGVGKDSVPLNFDPKYVDEIIKVSDKDSAIMTRKLARLEGIFAGWSCGFAVHGALEYARNLGTSDVVVVLLPDHGSRYLGKVYNEQWMRDRNFLEEGTFMTAEEIIRHKPKKGIAHLSPNNTLAEAIQIMRDTGISQLPVLSDTQVVVGSINESRLLNALIDDPKMRDEPLQTVMSDPFPFVLPSTRMDVISKMISKDSPAVLVKGFDGELDIITKHDLITVLAGKV